MLAVCSGLRVVVVGGGGSGDGGGAIAVVVVVVVVVVAGGGHRELVRHCRMKAAEYSTCRVIDWHRGRFGSNPKYGWVYQHHFHLRCTQNAILVAFGPYR